MLEQESHNTPENANQQTEELFDVMSLKKIDMTVEEYNQYVNMEPGDPQFAELLGRYGITQGEFIRVSATGAEDPKKNIERVVTTSENDPFTTNRALTNKLKEVSMLEHDENAEQVVTTDEVRARGGYVLGAMGVEVPVKLNYERDDGAFSYLREALPPVVRPDSSPDNYDVLLYGSDEEVAEMHAAAQLTHEQELQQKYYDRFVTPANKESSVETLVESIKANPALGRVLREAGVDTFTIDAVDAIRENPDVRYEVAKYFTQKLDAMVSQDPHGFGWRVEENRADNLKVDPQTGKRMKSRLYAVSLALKMLDGEFSVSHEDDSFTRDADGRVAVAQHRDAARRILFY
jgi:hypothetical protein